MREICVPRGTGIVGSLPEEAFKNLPGELTPQEIHEDPRHQKHREPAAQNEDALLVSDSLFDQTLARLLRALFSTKPNLDL